MADPMTAPAPDLDALERLLEEATPGPWCVDDHIVTEGDTPEQWHVYEQCEDDPPLATCFHGHAEADARLIAAAVNALPALMAAARERDALTDHWCKDGETLAERLQRERDETVRLMDMLAAERQRAEQAEQREARLRAALEEVTAMVRGECPSLLNEDSGGNGVLALEIDAALAEGQDG